MLTLRLRLFLSSCAWLGGSRFVTEALLGALLLEELMLLLLLCLASRSFLFPTSGTGGTFLRL